jgi:hypothetical protein
MLSVRWLDVDAPRLSALDVGNYFMFSRFDGNSSIDVRAPALVKLGASLGLGCMQLELQRHTIQLLQQCRPVDGHSLWLYVPQVRVFPMCAENEVLYIFFNFPKQSFYYAEAGETGRR